MTFALSRQMGGECQEMDCVTVTPINGSVIHLFVNE